MPYTKFISGHSGSYFIARYLTKNGRAIAFDSLNLLERESDGMRWWRAMDAVRHDFGNDKVTGKGRARTYEHIIISLDESDSADLDEFRDYVNEVAERWFAGTGARSLGSFQVAIVYHDDNLERTEKGKKGILHAHLIVNNTDLETGRRLAPRLTLRAVQAFRKDVNDSALAHGFSAFASDGASHSAEEFAELGLETAPTRAMKEISLRFPEISDAIDGEQPKDVGTPAKSAVEASVRTVRERRPVRKTPRGETRKRTRDGWSWKGEIEERVSFALKISRNRSDFTRVLTELGVKMERASKGGIMFVHPDGGKKKVRGRTLGYRFTDEGIAATLAGNSIREAVGGSATELSDGAIAAVCAELSRIPTGTREGNERVQALFALMDYVSAKGIESERDFPATAEGRSMLLFAKRIGMFAEADREDGKRRRTDAPPTPKRTKLAGSAGSGTDAIPGANGTAPGRERGTKDIGEGH